MQRERRGAGAWCPDAQATASVTAIGARKAAGAERQAPAAIAKSCVTAVAATTPVVALFIMPFDTDGRAVGSMPSQL
jgi:hypothetical protein